MRNHRFLKYFVILGAAMAMLVMGCTQENAEGQQNSGSLDDEFVHDHANMTPVATGDLVPPVRHTGPQGNNAQFLIECEFSHAAPDDPIVVPGRPGAMHMHDFFGNTTTDAYSTYETLLAGDTTCQTRADKAAYWAPALFNHGEQVTPRTSLAYYRPAPGIDPTTLEPYPPGLKIVSGDMAAAEPQHIDLVGWACGTSPKNHHRPPECPRSAPLRANIVFPDCWDGQNVDSEDHKSHMVHSGGNGCPESHPVSVPQLTFVVIYDMWGEGNDLTIASGDPITLHADFVNSWEQDALIREITTCLHRGAVCRVSSGRTEHALFGSSS